MAHIQRLLKVIHAVVSTAVLWIMLSMINTRQRRQNALIYRGLFLVFEVSSFVRSQGHYQARGVVRFRHLLILVLERVLLELSQSSVEILEHGGFTDE